MVNEEATHTFKIYRHIYYLKNALIQVNIKFK